MKKRKKIPEKFKSNENLKICNLKNFPKKTS